MIKKEEEEKNDNKNNNEPVINSGQKKHFSVFTKLKTNFIS
jgi:hypothetical protein